MLVVPSAHPIFTFWLDLADKVIKLAAVALGGVWTYWNYRKSRTYAQKMELQLSATLLRRDTLYLEAVVVLKNLGATTHLVQQTGSSCEIFAVAQDLSLNPLRVLTVFALDDLIEPGESISDVLLCRIDADLGNTVWLRIDVRVVSGSIEWHQSKLIRLKPPKPAQEWEQL